MPLPWRYGIVGELRSGYQFGNAHGMETIMTIFNRDFPYGGLTAAPILSEILRMPRRAVNRLFSSAAFIFHRVVRPFSLS